MPELPKAAVPVAQPLIGLAVAKLSKVDRPTPGAQLPPDHHFDLPGGHDWPVWRALWQQWLARGLIASGAV